MTQFALDIEETVAVGVSVPLSDARADQIPSGLPGEPFTNGLPRLGKFALRLLLECWKRGRRGDGQHRMHTTYAGGDSAQEALSKHPLAHP